MLLPIHTRHCKVAKSHTFTIKFESRSKHGKISEIEARLSGVVECTVVICIGAKQYDKLAFAKSSQKGVLLIILDVAHAEVVEVGHSGQWGLGDFQRLLGAVIHDRTTRKHDRKFIVDFAWRQPGFYVVAFLNNLQPRSI